MIEASIGLVAYVDIFARGAAENAVISGTDNIITFVFDLLYILH